MWSSIWKNSPKGEFFLCEICWKLIYICDVDINKNPYNSGEYKEGLKITDYPKLCHFKVKIFDSLEKYANKLAMACLGMFIIFQDEIFRSTLINKREF